MYSDNQGRRWRKTSYSPDWDNCVEMGSVSAGVVGIRDTKQHGAGPVLALSAADAAMFLKSVKQAV